MARGANAPAGSVQVNPAVRGILGGGTRPATGADLTGRLRRVRNTSPLTVPVPRR